MKTEASITNERSGKVRDEIETNTTPKEIPAKGIIAAGGLIGALAASSCCILPLALFGLGVSGAWIGNLAALAPYQPIFVAITLGFLVAGYWMVYRRPKMACADGSSCDRPEAARIVKVALWSATVLVAAAIAFPYAAPLLLDV